MNGECVKRERREADDTKNNNRLIVLNKMGNAFNIPDESIEFFKNQFDNSGEEAIELLLTKLRGIGISKMQAVYLLVEEGKLSMARAGNIVTKSKAWD